MFESPIHWIIALVIILILFGGKRIPEIMKGFGEGIRSFKEGMSGASQTPAPPTQAAPAPPAAPAPQPSEEKK
ncbi:MAG TPA: twin-arginine translocase TatA/TatE family subunit [Candidatus Acidoferrum sp.]|nr:twin-arginine translocase TatA/TatE family subunit [Candidatus Acidoferrum sp.]